MTVIVNVTTTCNNTSCHGAMTLNVTMTTMCNDSS